MTLRYNWYV